MSLAPTTNQQELPAWDAVNWASRLVPYVT
jgi:hypothetical protein